MRKLLIVIVLFTCVQSKSQSVNIGDTLFANKIGASNVHKMSTPIEPVVFKVDFYFIILDNYARYGYDLAHNYKVVTSNGDTGWIKIVTLNRSLENGIIFNPDVYRTNKLKFSNSFASLMNSKFWIGMRLDELVLSYGKPDKINTTITNGLISKQVIYGDINATYFYFDNDILKSIQN